MRAKITVEKDGSVTLAHDVPAHLSLYVDKRSSTNYFVGSDGGYVRIFDKNGNYRQACENLSSNGSALSSTRENLPALIRAEWRKCKLRAGL